jgi:hypothetical protein
MRYKIDNNKIEEGFIEALKAKINSLEEKLNNAASKSEIQETINEYLECERVAKTFLIPTDQYQNILLSHERELKQKYGIKLL